MDSVVEYTELLTGVRLERLTRIASLDEGGGYRYNAYTSTSAFLMHRCGMSAGEANREVFLARSMREMPYAVKSAYAGHISASQLEILAHGRHRHPQAFAEDEPGLVEAVRGLTVGDTRAAVDHWIHLHDEAEGRDPDEEPSQLFLSKTWQGRGRLDGDLDPVSTDLVNTALDSLMSEMVRHTPREALGSASQRRAEALTEMARRFLDSPEAPTDHGNRPHLTVVIDWQTLTGRREGPLHGFSQLLDGTSLPPGEVQRLACDAEVCRLLVGPEGEILDLGRSQRTVSPAQWRALRVRDRHCQWWGCRRPAAWCDAHHIRFWDEHDGPTDLSNLILLCRYHHTLVHRHGWELTGTPGDITITRPDGTVLPNAPP